MTIVQIALIFFIYEKYCILKILGLTRFTVMFDTFKTILRIFDIRVTQLYYLQRKSCLEQLSGQIAKRAILESTMGAGITPACKKVRTFC